MKLVDSHCHLNFDDYGEDLNAVIQRALDQNITRMLSICTKLAEAPGIIALVQPHDALYCTVGVHPHEAKEAVESGTLAQDLARLAQADKVVGLGETGLDYYYENSPRTEQKQSFAAHIDLAKERDLPLIIHTRDAEADTVDLLTPAKGQVRGVFHCFSGSADLARAALDLGFYISISGIVTFKKADDLREVVEKIVPLDRLLLETDAPFLAPIPHRGKRNEPAFMIHTAELVAELKGVPLEDLAHRTTQNFETLFLS